MNRQELERLTQGMADGALSAEEVSLLGDELESNPASREFYRRSMKVELLLGEALQRRLVLPPPQKQAVTPGVVGLARRRQGKPMLRFAMAAAVVILSALILQQIFFRAPGPDIHVTFSPGTSWSGPVGDDGKMAFGKSVKIEFGVAEFNLPGDVRAVIEGPAEVELPNPGLLVLREGSGWFQVGEAGHGFRVRTPSVEVVDHGTEFGLVTHPNEPDAVHVFEGRVNCSARFAMKESQELGEGKALSVSLAGRWIEQELDEQRFLTSLPPELPGIRFSFDGKNPLKPEGELPAVKGMKVQTRGGLPAKLVDGVKGKALSLREAGDVVRTDWQGLGGATPRTIACWIRPDGDHGARLSGIVSWGDPSASRLGRCNFMIGKSRKSGERVMRFAVGHAVQFSGTTPIVPGKWQHVALVFRGTGNIDGDMVELYLNGEREQVDPELSRLPKDDRVITTVIDGPNSQPLQIGCGPFPDSHLAPFFGDIDEVWILPRALSAREVKGLRGRSKSGLPVKTGLPAKD